jgi:ferritin
MMFSRKLQDALNKQMNQEFYSEYMYLAMTAYLRYNSLDGVASFFLGQSQEEHAHAMKIFDFLNEKGGRVTLEAIDGPQVEFKSVADVFKTAVDHERAVSKSINKLMDLAIAENEHSVKSFLQWFVDEQVEEEALFDRLLNKVKLAGDGQGLLIIDSQLANFVPKGKT